jgi:hypothetical protein
MTAPIKVFLAKIETHKSFNRLVGQGNARIAASISPPRTFSSSRCDGPSTIFN